MARANMRQKNVGPATPSVEVGGGVGPRFGSEQAPCCPLSPLVPSRPARRGLPPLGIVVMSTWGWRILAVFAMVAFGLCITFFLDGHTIFGALWLFIAASWGWFTYKLRLRHLAWDAEQ